MRCNKTAKDLLTSFLQNLSFDSFYLIFSLSLSLLFTRIYVNDCVKLHTSVAIYINNRGRIYYPYLAKQFDTTPGATNISVRAERRGEERNTRLENFQLLGQRIRAGIVALVLFLFFFKKDLQGKERPDYSNVICNPKTYQGLIEALEE